MDFFTLNKIIFKMFCPNNSFADCNNQSFSTYRTKIPYGKLPTSSLREKFLLCIVHRPRIFSQKSCKILVARSYAKFAYFLKGTRDYNFVESSLSSDQALNIHGQ